MVLSQFFDVLGKTSSIVSIISFAILIKSLLILWHLDKKRKIELDIIRRGKGYNPAFLIVDIGEHTMRPVVENWLVKQEGFKEYVKDDNIFYMDFNRKVNEVDINDILGEFRKKVGNIFEKGADKIHLFYRGPVAIATMIGAELSNKFPVTVYHNDTSTGCYSDWGPLKRN